MTTARMALISVFIAVVVAGHAFDIVVREEHWPFSNYPMYAETFGPFVARKELFGVTRDGHEVELDVKKHLGPLDNTRMHWALNRILRERGRASYEDALHVLLRRYEERRVRGEHSGPPIVALRSYLVRYATNAPIAKATKRKLQFEVSTSDAAPEPGSNTKP